MTSESTIKKNDKLLERLREPFPPDQILWRVVDIAPDNSGLVHAYAKKRSYHDRLNKVLTPSGWSSVYNTNIIPMQRIKANQLINTGKVYLTCTLTIDNLGTHTALGEAWADEDNAICAAEVQGFKRACVQFGLGRYLDMLNANALWVRLDHRNQPVVRPELPGWAVPKSIRGKASQPTVVRTQPLQSANVSTAGEQKPEPPGVKAQSTIIPTQPQQSTNVSTAEVKPAEQAGPTVEEQLQDIERISGSLCTNQSSNTSDYFEQKRYGGDRDKKTLECCNRAQEVIQKLRASSERVGKARFGAILDEYNVPTLNAFASIDQMVQVADAFERIAA